MKRQKLNRYERRIMHAEKLKQNFEGSGIYIYENNTDGDLTLPKATSSGVRIVGARRRFQGDSYFMKWVGNPMNLLRLVEVVQPAVNTNINTEEQTASENMNTEKQLILDQPDTITHQGKIERVIQDPNTIPLNDATAIKPNTQPETLINEAPIDGVEIIID